MFNRCGAYLGEPLTAAMVAGFVLILAGLAVAVADSGRTSAAPSAIDPTCVPH
jgi:hypothetical protein